jgi:hypothetical protein
MHVNNSSLPDVPEPIDRRAARRARRAERRAARYGGAWLIGAALIILGVIFMLQNTGALHLNNWWALFFLLPAAGSFATAYSSYRNQGRFTATSRSALIGGLVLTALAALFLFNLDWGKLWPVLLILAGIGALINAWLPA